MAHPRDPIRKVTQNGARKSRFLLVATTLLAALAAVAWWAFGATSAEKFTYVPNREYRLAETEKPEPATLKELLNSSSPSLETLLKNPSIAEELASAKSLTDIVDSRTALNNLRNLDAQITKWLQELPELALEKPSEESSNEQALNLVPEPGTVRNVDWEYSSPSWEYSSPSVDTSQLLQAQADFISNLQEETRRLLAVPSYDRYVTVPPSVNMKGTWQSPDENLIHMVPSGGWAPEEGYKLYRAIGEQRELLAENLMSPSSMIANLTIEQSDVIKDTILAAQLTPDKLTLLEMTADEFGDLAYSTDVIQGRPRIDGKQDFVRMGETLLTIPASAEQKMPETDRLLHSSVHVLGEEGNDTFTLSSLQTDLWQNSSLNAVGVPTGLDALQVEPDGDSKWRLARSILEARQQLATLSFVDAQFAEEAGFLFRDDLSGLNLAADQTVIYVLETPGGVKTTLPVKRGTENKLSKPKGLLGYGIDGKVPLRWDQPEDPKERSILSGYFLERKLDGEEEFTQVNEEPVVVTYTLDETGIYFESPIFYEDEVENGRTAQYRIRSIDIFGRTSEYSDVLTCPVQKVTPPNSPTVETPVLSDDPQGADQPVLDAIALNGNRRGIVLPIYTDSPDTVRFTIYRAAKLGAQGYGDPEPIANLLYDNPAAGLAVEDTEGLQLEAAGGYSAFDLKQAIPATIVQRKLNKAVQVQLTNPSNQHPDLIYFDSQIEEGYTYKYWVSAWDSWNNESMWSPSVSAAVPTAREPEAPDSLRVSMSARELPDFSQEPPGLLYDDVVSYEQLGAAALSFPKRQFAPDIDTEIILEAEERGISIGEFIQKKPTDPWITGESVLSPYIDERYNNLPEERYIHMFVAIRGEDVLPDGTARLKWPAYSGDGLAGYSVYRPMFATPSLQEMQKKSRDELLRMGRWYRTNDTVITNNQYVVSGLNRTPGSASLFLICLEPAGSSADGLVTLPGMSIGIGWSESYLESLLRFLPEAGYVYVRWDAPSDPQIDYYRVYRAEVPSFKEPVDESTLEWVLVGDHITAPIYTDVVEQSFAHYYYYKVTSVSPWGVESAVGAVQRFRVPSTKPPETPNLLLPLSRKDGVQVNFSAVSHADRYEIYRAHYPIVDEIPLDGLLTDVSGVLGALFDSPSDSDAFLSDLLSGSLRPSGLSSVGEDTPLNPLLKLKTVSKLQADDITANLGALSARDRAFAYRSIVDRLGPLAVSDYWDLSEGMLRKVRFIKVGEVPADYDTAEAVDPATGLLKPLSFIDTTAEYGVTYLYTVQAWNDDNLGSSRPDPVEATPRRSRPFDPITGLQGEIKDDKPHLRWNPPTMPLLTLEQCRRDTVGYIVYRSDTRDGTYYQASPLVFETRWVDEDADPYAMNYYKVKVLDTGGYLSEFGEPVLVRKPFIPEMTTVIPEFPFEIETPGVEPVLIAPKIGFANSSFTIQEGTPFSVQYGLSGTEPITVTVTARKGDGSFVAGFSVDTASRTVSAPQGLKAGSYTVTVKAKNEAGESSAGFSLEVKEKAQQVVIAPEIAFDGTNFSVNEGTAFETVYEITGTEPIIILVTATGPAGQQVSGFSVNTASRLLTGPKDLKPGTYTINVAARNSAGVSTASLTLEVRASRTAPKLSIRPDGYAFTMTSGTDFSAKISASGSEPFTWSLERVGGRVAFPPVVDISPDGVLSINGDIAPGNYGFVIRVANDVGSDARNATLKVEEPAAEPPVKPPIKPIDPPIIKPPVTPIEPTDPPIKPKSVRWDGGNAGTVNLTTQASSAQLGTKATVTPVSVTTLPVTPGTTGGQNQSGLTQSSERVFQRVMCKNFVLTNVRVSKPDFAGARYSGTALLNTAYGEPIPVKIGAAVILDGGSVPEMTMGSVYIDGPHELSGIGVTLVSLEISPASAVSKVSGYVKSTLPEQNLVGDLRAIQFTNAELTNDHIILRRFLPDIRYERFVLHDVSEIRIRLNGNEPGKKDFLSVTSGVEMRSHLETLNNEGIEFDPGLPVRFDLQGRMNATLHSWTEQFLQLLVPGGAGIRVETAALTYVDGVVQPGGRLVGRLIVPFEKHDVYGPVVPADYVGGHLPSSEMDEIMSSGNTLPIALIGAVNEGLVKFAETVQQNGMLILPDDFDLQAKCSYVPLDIYDWTGEGFLMESSYMAPARVTERSLDAQKQRDQAIVVSPSAVTVDLDRESYLPKEAGSQTPNETEEPFWVGLVMKGGELMLPPAFIQTKDAKPIVFQLAPGEMIYDLNGFNYQTYLYSNEGVPAVFGKALGSFDDVLVYDCLLDLYANRVNLEVNAKVAVDLFQKNWVDVKLYTNKEDNADGKAGEFLCSVAPTAIEDAIADDIDVRIDGGWMRPDGMHLSGAILLPALNSEGFDVRCDEELGFTDMIVPSELAQLRREENPEFKYAAFALDKPTNISFHGFTMEVRSLDMEYRPGDFARPVRISLHGATLLAETIPLSDETTDTVIIDCGSVMFGSSEMRRVPKVTYDESRSVLEATFEECIDVSGVLVPKPVQSSGRTIEFDTNQLNLTYLKQLEELPVKTETRFGYDKDMKRCYFAIGLMPQDAGSAIGFGSGKIKDFSGVVAYNMTVAKDGEGRYEFPANSNGIPGFIQGLQVHSGSNASFAAGIKGTLVIPNLCEIRDMYFGFRTGPAVTANGQLYLPLNVGAILFGGDSYTAVGTASISYSHPDRYFSFSMTLNDMDVLVARVSGSLGFEYSPRLFGVQLGYPETLAGNIGIFRVGAGLALRIDQDGASYVRAKMEFGLDKQVSVSIVYLRGYLYAGADGGYYFEGADRLTLELYLKGGIEGGIVVDDRRFNIISFYLDARGSLEAQSPFDSWWLAASCKVSYSLDLWLFEVEGSVNASFDTRIV